MNHRKDEVDEEEAPASHQNIENTQKIMHRQPLTVNLIIYLKEMIRLFQPEEIGVTESRGITHYFSAERELFS